MLFEVTTLVYRHGGCLPTYKADALDVRQSSTGVLQEAPFVLDLMSLQCTKNTFNFRRERKRGYYPAGEMDPIYQLLSPLKLEQTNILRRKLLRVWVVLYHAESFKVTRIGAY